MRPVKQEVTWEVEQPVGKLVEKVLARRYDVFSRVAPIVLLQLVWPIKDEMRLDPPGRKS